MDDLDRLIDEMVTVASRDKSPRSKLRLLARARALLYLYFRGRQDPSEDPFSYVTARLKPRLPHLSAAAAAKLDD